MLLITRCLAVIMHFYPSSRGNDSECTRVCTRSTLQVGIPTPASAALSMWGEPSTSTVLRVAHRTQFLFWQRARYKLPPTGAFLHDYRRGCHSCKWYFSIESRRAIATEPTDRSGNGTSIDDRYHRTMESVDTRGSNVNKID